HFDWYQIPRFVVSQGVGEVVEIPDILAIEGDKNIAPAQACFGGRAAFANIGKAHTLGGLIKIRDAAEIGTITGDVTSVRNGAGGPGDAHEHRAVWRGRHALGKIRDVIE